MRRSWVFFIGVLALVIAGCGGATYQPLVAHRVFQSQTKAQVFDAVVRALHTADFLIATADKDSGIIGTDWKEFAVGKVRFRIRLNLLVFEEAAPSVAVSFKSVVHVRHKGDWREIQAGDSVDAESFAQMTRTLDDFFLEVQRYAGPSIQQR